MAKFKLFGQGCYVWIFCIVMVFFSEDLMIWFAYHDMANGVINGILYEPGMVGGGFSPRMFGDFLLLLYYGAYPVAPIITIYLVVVVVLPLQEWINKQR